VPGVQTWGNRLVLIYMRELYSVLTVIPQTSYVYGAVFMWLQSGNQTQWETHHLCLLRWKSKFFHLEIMKLVHDIVPSSLVVFVLLFFSYIY
jgi:hypothetical protein